jgi:tight adherence protein C
MSYLTLMMATGLALEGLAIGIVVYFVAKAPSRTASRLGLRGLKRQRALRDNSLWAQTEPLIRWLGVRVNGILTDEQYAAMDRQLMLAGDYMGLTPEEYLALSILSAIGGTIAGAIAGWLLGMGPVLPLVVMPLGASLPYMAVSEAHQDRMKQVNRGLPYAIDLMALAMSAGQDFPGAVRQVVEKSSNPDDALVAEFAVVLQELGLGMTRKQALESFARRSPTDAVNEFVGAVVQAEERGNPVSAVLQIQASVSRIRRTVRAEENAAKAGVAMVGPLMLVFMCIMMIVMGPMLLRVMRDFS